MYAPTPGARAILRPALQPRPRGGVRLLKSIRFLATNPPCFIPILDLKNTTFWKFWKSLVKKNRPAAGGKFWGFRRVFYAENASRLHSGTCFFKYKNAPSTRLGTNSLDTNLSHTKLFGRLGTVQDLVPTHLILTYSIPSYLVQDLTNLFHTKLFGTRLGTNSLDTNLFHTKLFGRYKAHIKQTVKWVGTKFCTK